MFFPSIFTTNGSSPAVNVVEIICLLSFVIFALFPFQKNSGPYSSSSSKLNVISTYLVPELMTFGILMLALNPYGRVVDPNVVPMSVPERFSVPPFRM